MQKRDYRDYTGTEVLPNFDDKNWLTENFKEMINAASEIPRGNNVSMRKRTIQEAASKMKYYLWGMLQNDERKGKAEATKAKESLNTLQREANGSTEEHIYNISTYFYQKGITAWDAKDEDDPGRAVLK